MPRERVRQGGEPYEQWAEQYGDLEPYDDHPLRENHSLTELRRDPRIGVLSEEKANEYGRCGAELESGMYCAALPRSADTVDGGDRCWRHSR